MKKLALGSPANPGDIGWAHRALKAIERASYEDVEAVADEYTITGTITELREFDAGAATATEMRNVFATFLNDLQKRGSKRNPDEA